MYGEIGSVVIGKAIASTGYFVTVNHGGLPCVEASAVHGESDVAAGRIMVIGGSVIGVDLGIESQFGQHEPCHRTGDASIVVALIVAVCQWQGFRSLLQLVYDKSKHRAALALGGLGE